MLQFFKRKIRDYYINNQSIPDVKKSLQFLKASGYAPSCIFDIGAYEGEFAKLCFSLWPSSSVVCFEPLKAKYDMLKNWAAAEKRVKAIHGLVGNENIEQVKFNENETASSVLDEFNSTNFSTTYQPMRTLDNCIKEFSLPVPSFVKIDTQGFEYQVVEGLLGNIKNVDVVLAELNHIDIHKNVKLAEEVIHLLYQNGFVIFDIAEIHRRPKDNAIWQTDFVFVKKDSIFRQDKSWK